MKTQKAARKIITFEAEDAAVLALLSKAERQGRGIRSKLINEAIRLHGNRALLNILARDVKTAESKLTDAAISIAMTKCL